LLKDLQFATFGIRVQKFIRQHTSYMTRNLVA